MGLRPEAAASPDVLVARGALRPPTLTQTHQSQAPLLSEPEMGIQPNKSSNALTLEEVLTVRSVNPAHPCEKETPAVSEVKSRHGPFSPSPARGLMKVATGKSFKGWFSGQAVDVRWGQGSQRRQDTEGP